MRKIWDPFEDAIMMELYPHMRSDKLAREMRRTVCSLYGRADLLKLRKTREFLQSPDSGRLVKGYTVGADTQFPKGHKSFNKGKKQREYMSRAAINRTKATRFKPGQKPPNTKFDLCITTRNETLKNGKVIPYKWIRMSNANWKMLHVRNWEAVNGPVPKGFIVVFKNKNSLDCEVQNLELISLAENMKRNTIHRYPAELKQTIRALSKLKKTINNGKK